AQLFGQLRDDLFLVTLLQPRHGRPRTPSKRTMTGGNLGLTLLAVRRAGLAQRPQGVATLLAVQLLVPIVAVALAGAHAAAAGRAVEHDVGDVDGHLLGQPAALRVLPAGPQVLVHPVDALDDDLALFGQHAEDAGDLAVLRRAGVVAGDDFHQVVFADV